MNDLSEDLTPFERMMQQWDAFSIGDKVRIKKTGKIGYVVEKWGNGSIFVGDQPDGKGLSYSPSELERLKGINISGSPNSPLPINGSLEP